MNDNQCTYFSIQNDCTFSKYGNEDKCIFHCDKTQMNGWIVPFHNINNESHESKKTKWIREKVQEFWRKFNIYKQKHSIIDGFQFPIYWELQYEHVSLLDNLSNKLEFESCIFLDYFRLDSRALESPNLNSFNLSFLRSKFYSLLELNSLKLNRLSLLANEHFNSNIEFSNLEVENDSEICRSEGINEILLFDNIHTQLFEVCYNQCNKINFEGSTYENLKIKNNKIKELILEDINLQKMKIQEQNGEYRLIDIKLNNLEFEEGSRILFENILCENFELKKLSQASKFIQFDHINIKKEFILSQNEFKNTYFNDFDIATATKKIEKTSFIDSRQNSIKWGNISELEASKDIFRQLKFVNDSQANYIIANDFYVMEMHEHEKELQEKPWNSKYLQDKLIFLLSKKISNHSQSWFLALLWIFLSSIGFYTIACLFKVNNYEEVSLTLVIFMISSMVVIPIICNLEKWKIIKLYYLQYIVPIFIFIFITYFIDLGEVNNMDNFVKFMGLKPPEEFSGVLIWWFLNKIITGFLAYHFIISLRRQTKR